jgi:hypothetical protein
MATVLPLEVMRGRMLNRRIRRNDALAARRHIESPPSHSTVHAKHGNKRMNPAASERSWSFCPLR